VPKSRVLDAAIPSRVVKDQTAEIQVLVRLPDSPGLKGILLTDEDAEARPEDVHSKDFKITFLLGRDGKPEALKVRVLLTSPDFNPPVQAKSILVPADGDSEVVTFLLTPLRAGKLKVLVELQWEEAVRGARRLLTECVADVASVVSARTHLVRIPLGVETERVSSLTASSASSPDTGSFAPLFRSEFKPQTKPTSKSAGPPPNLDDTNARELTEFFRGPLDREEPAKVPVILPKLLDPPQRNGTGELTRVFESGKAGQSPTRPLQEPLGDTSQEPGSSTQSFPVASQPAASTLREAEPSLPDGATHAFSAPGRPSPSTPPLPAGPSEYTGIIAGGCLNPPEAPIAGGSQNPVPSLPKIAAPPPPKFSLPAPKVPQLEIKPPKPKASYLLLVIILNVLLFIAILLIVYFAVKH
jgi:hypothetical protein